MALKVLHSGAGGKMGGVIMMRAITVIALLLLTLVISFTAGCPFSLVSSGVDSPAVAPDNLGGSIIVYQVYEGGNRTSYVQRVSAEGDFLWAGEGKALFSVEGRTEGGYPSASMVSDDDGGAILVWVQDSELRAQRVDVGGSFLWPAGGIEIATGYASRLEMLSDGSGGAIVAWHDSYDVFYLQKIDSQGNLPWRKSGLITNGTRFFDIAGDSEGNTFVSWQDSDLSTFVQKVDADGNILWQQGGLLVCRGHGGGADMYAICGDESGGAIVVWVYEVYDEGGSVSGAELRAQRISAEGEILWQEEGVSVAAMSEDAHPVEPQIVGDGSGGAIISWRNPLDIYAQRLDSSGNRLWAEKGVRVWQLEGPQSPEYSLIGDGFGGIIVVWRYFEEGKTVDQGGILRAQRLDAGGEALWETNGTLVSSGFWDYCSPPVISQDGYGGVIVSWTAGRSVHHASSSYFQILNAEGALLWGEGGIRLDD